MSSDYVLSFHQDHLGYVWIGTESGLDRFDGQNFLHFGHDPEDPETLDYDWVITVFEDSKHNLWVGTEKGVNRLNRQTGKIERIPMFKSSDKVQGTILKFCEDANGALWVYTTNNGLFQLKYQSEQGGNWSAEHFFYQDSLSSPTNQKKQNYLHYASPEVLWLGNRTAIKRLHIPSRTLTYYYVPSREGSEQGTVEIIKSSYLEDGTILIYTQNNFHVLDTKADAPQIKSLAFVSQRATEEIDNISQLNFSQDTEDRLLISNYRDLFFFNTISGQLESIQPQNQTSNRSLPNIIRSLYKDRQGNYWVGTLGSGFYLIRKVERPFTLFQNDPADQNSISNGQIRTLAEDDSGNLWVGILNHGLDQFEYQNDGRLLKKKSLVPIAGQPNTLVSNRIIKLIQGPEKTLWIATLTNGVQKMDEAGSQFKTFDYKEGEPNSLSANRIWGLVKDKEGFIWTGSWHKGLNRIDPETGQIKRFRHDPSNPNSLVSDKIRCLYVDQSGILWIGTNSGLGSYNPRTGQFTQFKHKSNDPTSISDDLVWTILKDQKGDLWVGTNTGLNRYDAEKNGFERFYEKNGLPNNTIYGLLEDDTGVLWVSTENGLARQLSSESDLAFFPLGLEDGLQATSFVPKAYLNSSSSEQLFFGSTQGILAVKPSLLQLDTPQPQFKLHAVSTFNPFKKEDKRTTNFFISSIEESVNLGHKDQSLTISLSDLNWKKDRNLRYDYQLVGFDKQWMPLGKDLQITFSNLPTGKYRLLARARNAENISSTPSELLRLRILPPWWASWWAYFGYLLVVVAGILVIYRFQLQRQLEQQEAQNLRSLDAFKNKLYANITHEFRTPLTIISGMIDQIEKNPSQWLKKGAEMIRTNNHNLLDLINQMLELQKVESGRLKAQLQLGDIIPFLHTLFEQFQALSQSKEQQLEFRTELESLQMDFDWEKTLRIVSNLLSNAIKYTPEKGNIIFQVSTASVDELLTQQSSILTVKDTGPGIPKEELPYIFNRFYQANANTSRTGTGIGLSLTKELVKLLNGKIEVSSDKGRGSTFQVALPITQNT
ncbi:MAG: two-component regulator propeller domain-containing protein, partial [Bacteroidota bacterium]